MKICPACSETFSDDFSFCELDGSKLKRQAGAAAEPGAKKDWSLLGLVLVLGAVLITVATIIFAPKARFSASTPTKDSVAVAPPQQTSPNSPAVIDTTPSAATDEASASEGDALLPTTETKKKEKVAKTDTTNAETPNPKDAVQDPANDPKAAAQPSEPPAPKAAAKSEPAATESKEPEKPHSVAPAPETRETRKAEAKPADKEDPKKKDEKKKKGGFFGVFKKIFGKDN